MPFGTIPHPPNAAWMPPIDPNDQQALQQQQMMIEEQFKTILTQEIVNGMGNIEIREQQQQEQEDEDGDDMEEYGDEIQIPEGEQDI